MHVTPGLIVRQKCGRRTVIYFNFSFYSLGNATLLAYTTATPTTTPSPTPSQWPTTTSTPGQCLSNWIFFSGITEVCSSREIVAKNLHQTNFCLKRGKTWLRQNIGFIRDLLTCKKKRQIIASVLISTSLTSHQYYYLYRNYHHRVVWLFWIFATSFRCPFCSSSARF